jgi:hypothetical protein
LTKEYPASEANLSPAAEGWRKDCKAERPALDRPDITTAPTTIVDGATFTGLVAGGVPLSNIGEVNIDF